MMGKPLYSKEKCLGLMYGLMIGDALGSEFNEKKTDEIPSLDINYFKKRSPKNYTDDTEMAISVFEEMLENGEIKPFSLRDRFLKRYSYWRGYSGGMLEVIEKWREGVSITDAAASLYNGNGSFGDGAAVRSSPISLFFRKDEIDILHSEVKKCALLTHTHSYGISGALLQASAVLLALNDVSPEEWLNFIFKLPLESTFKIKIGTVSKCLSRKASAYESSKEIGNGSQAIEAVPLAIYSVLRYPYSFFDAITFAVSMGGDTDTIAAMAGAILGAFLGVEKIPQELVSLMADDKDWNNFIDLIERSYSH